VGALKPVNLTYPVNWAISVAAGAIEYSARSSSRPRMHVRPPSAAGSVDISGLAFLTKPSSAGSREALQQLLSLQRMRGDLRTIDAEIVPDGIGVQPLPALDEIAGLRTGGERRAYDRHPTAAAKMKRFLPFLPADHLVWFPRRRGLWPNRDMRCPAPRVRRMRIAPI
jgi:hypothetical protein